MASKREEVGTGPGTGFAPPSERAAVGPAKTQQVQDWLAGLQVTREADVDALCQPVEHYED